MGRSYKDLVAWQKSMDLVTATYRTTAGFPRDELFGLTSQLRRAAVSIPSNIAEGQGRLSEKEFRYFLGQARGSLMEVETQIQIAENLGYLKKEQTAPLLQSCAEVGRILNGLLTSVSKQAES
jgi:four helix bundle protein